MLRRILGVLVLVLVATTALLIQPARAVTPVGGLVQLVEPSRDFDTRLSPGGVTGPIGLSGVAHLWVLGAAEPGTVTITPCALGTGPTYTMRYDAHETVYTSLASSEAMCATSSTPVDFIGDSLGNVLSSPAPTGLQYVPLPTPVPVFDGETSGVALQATEQQFDLGVVPPEAGAAVLLLEALAPTSAGFATIHSCSSQSLIASVAFDKVRAVGIAYARLDALSRSTQCLRSYGTTPLRITLLGYLSSDGPDPTSLPPTLSSLTTPTRLPGFRAVSPERVVDTRSGLGAPAGKLQAGRVLEVSLNNLVGRDTSAVALNVTVTEPTGSGFLTAYPCDEALPEASNLNYVANQTVPNLVNVRLSLTGTVCLFTSQTTHVVVDLSGTFEHGGGSGSHSVSPERILDTRQPIGVATAAKLVRGQTIQLLVAGHGGVPVSGARGVTMNVTVTEPDGPGFLTVYPCDTTRPTVSNLNYIGSQTVPNLVSVRLPSDGMVCIFASETTHVIADVAGWFGVGEADGFRDVVPARILDTREAVGVPTTAKLASGHTLVLTVAGRGGVPETGVNAVTMNVTVTSPEAAGFLTVYPCDVSRPLVSNLNYDVGQTVPNLVSVDVSATGTVCIFTQQTTDVLADVSGYFSATTETIPITQAVPAA